MAYRFFLGEKIMLFYLDDNIIDNYNDTNLLAIQNIAECIQAGRHIIISNRKLLKSLYSLEALSPVTRRIFRTLYQQITQFGNLKEEFKTYIKISANAEEIKKIEKDKHTIYEIPLAVFCDSKHLQETKLLCEDLYDCDFYLALTDYFFRSEKLGVSIGFEKINGGGVNTFRMYENILSNNYAPCLVIADSDKNDVSTAIGETAQNIVKVCNDYNNHRATYSYILDVREKENLIPPEIYYAVETEETKKKDFELLVKICNNENFHTSYFYRDIKSGFNNDYDREELKAFVFAEVKDVLKKDCTIEELHNLVKPLRKLLGDKNVLCSVIDELYREDKRGNIINGVRKTFEKFKKEILDNELNNRILAKRKLADEYNSEKLKQELNDLEHQKDSINAAIQHSLKNDFINYWREIAYVCCNWGCKTKMHVA